MAPIELNFNPTENRAQMFNVPLERAEEIVEEIAVVVRDIIDHYADYRVPGTGKFEGKTRLNEGKALQDMLTVAKNVNEWLYILFCANPMYDKIRTLARLDAIGKQLDKMNS